MQIYTIYLPNVIPIKAITAKATYGIGFLTAFVGGFCSFFGIPNNMYTKKLNKAEALAMDDFKKVAKSTGADGVMDVRYQIDGLSFMVCGTAYKWSDEERATRRAAEEKAIREALEQARREDAKKVISPRTPEISSNNTNDSTKKEHKEKEEPQNILPCPQCGEDLAFMGWDDNDLKEKQTCPLCGKEILFNQ